MTRQFPYEDMESLFAAANHIIAAIMELPERDWSATVQEAVRVVDSTAKDNGFAWPMMPEESAVASALKKIFCGPRTAQYGWRLYKSYRKDGKLTPLSISY